ncbi:SusC/RagA family TonB-linked outer membrane protein [Moheibacter sediminis]|uniref:TonB-linked outer membrane protein, SusC/RagA family n=1 Tax=Moheibacter sediminis TaxID=1434700 RepID=A0A1W2C3E7_9FLAO|nr:SusC/RagA family TonB-linked outer membrane protein [Moheibacter sediminis]SMC79422.1 TonB-linked outer membrane protein, SusC/RagA family [Moheibacter sediminis]
MSTKLRGLLVFCGILLGGILFAQEKTVTGTVTDANGFSLPDVSVKSSSGKEVFTDTDGNYSIQTNVGEVLTIESMGSEIVTVVVGASNSYNATLRESGTIELEGAVVTALGITREKKSLGYSSQQLNAEQVNSSPTNNFLNNLSGKVAGLEVKANSNFGGSTNIVLRGIKSITGNNQALIVVDGVPINNANLNSADAANGRVGIDFGNSASDIDPNNIESVNVLKGAAATALYGSQAANGAIMITTKKGKRNQALGISLNSTVSVGMIDKETFPKYQKQYGAGYDGINSFGSGDINGDGIDDILAPYGADASYGVAFDPNLMVYQWNAFAAGNPNFGMATPWMPAKNGPLEFFNNSYSYVNSLNLNGGDDVSSFNLTFTNNHETGILPNSKLNRNIINGNYSRDFSDKLNVSAFMTFTDQSTMGRNKLGYNDNVMTGFRQWWPINVDVLELRNEYFRDRQNVTWNPVNPIDGDMRPAYWNNPYWDVYENYNTDERTRVLTGAALSYDVTPNLNVLGRVTIDYSTDRQEQRKAVGSHAELFGLTAAVNATETSGYWLYTRNYLQQTYDLIATYKWDISDKFGANFLAGGTFTKSNSDEFEASTAGGLVIPGMYTLANSTVIIAPEEDEILYEKSGIYAQASFDFANTLFLEGSVRRDESTALPVANNDYAYFSVGTSFVLSELIKAEWLNFAKLRASYAEVGNDPAAGRLGFKINRGLLGTDPMADNSATFVDFNKLKPEKQKSWEAGIEMAFLKRRVSFDVSVYQMNTTDQLFAVPQSQSTGYSFSYVNAGETENKGIEVTLGLIPFRSENFEWNINVNWSKNQNKVVSLNEGRDNLQLATFQQTSLNATVGEAFGTIRGTDFAYDENGNRIVGEDGFYLIESNKVLGDIQADWVGGIYNKIRYKNLSVGFLIDIKQGGDLFSLDQAYGQYTGLYPNTVGLNHLGNPIRNPLDQGGGVILPGVKEVFDSEGNVTGYIQNDILTDFSIAENRYINYPQKEFIYDASYVKLREASISYTIPERLLQNTFVKGATLSAIGNNLWIIHKNVPFADPEAGTSSGNIQGYQAGVMPTTRVFSFNVKLNF